MLRNIKTSVNQDCVGPELLAVISSISKATPPSAGPLSGSGLLNLSKPLDCAGYWLLFQLRLETLAATRVGHAQFGWCSHRLASSWPANAPRRCSCDRGEISRKSRYMIGFERSSVLMLP
jgi:hypothetical protein